MVPMRSKRFCRVCGDCKEGVVLAYALPVRPPEANPWCPVIDPRSWSLMALIFCSVSLRFSLPPLTYRSPFSNSIHCQTMVH